MSHLVTTLVVIALFCIAAIWFAEPRYLDDTLVYLNLKPYFADPARGMVGIVTLGHQLGYFNILSMYMVILLLTPAMLWLAARSLRLLLAVSIGLWLVAGIFTLDMPNYPLAGGWFFNPFAWQLLFVIGLVLGIKAPRRYRHPSKPLLSPRRALFGQISVRLDSACSHTWRVRPIISHARQTHVGAA
jgi:hypothetical protein